jgi:hypothetical protein
LINKIDPMPLNCGPGVCVCPSLAADLYFSLCQTDEHVQGLEYNVNSSAASLSRIILYRNFENDYCYNPAGTLYVE